MEVLSETDLIQEELGPIQVPIIIGLGRQAFFAFCCTLNTIFLLSNCCHNTQTLAIVGLFCLRKSACMVSKLYQKPPSL